MISRFQNTSRVHLRAFSYEPDQPGHSTEWDKYQIGFIWEEIYLTSLGRDEFMRSKVLERVHSNESERAMQNIHPG